MSGGPADIAARWNSGAAIESFTPAERQRLREDMRRQVDALSPKDPERARFTQDLRALYAADYSTAPEPAPVLVAGKFIDLNALIDLNAPRGGQ